MPPRSVTRVCDRCGRWFGKHEPDCSARQRRIAFIIAIVALAGGILYLALSAGGVL